MEFYIDLIFENDEAIRLPVECIKEYEIKCSEDNKGKRWLESGKISIHNFDKIIIADLVSESSALPRLQRCNDITQLDVYNKGITINITVDWNEPLYENWKENKNQSTIMEEGIIHITWEVNQKTHFLE